MTQGGGEETLFTLDANVQPVVDALGAVDDAMATTEAGVGSLADSFWGMDVATQSLARLTIASQAVVDMVAELGAAFEAGKLSLDDFVASGLPAEQVLAEIARLFTHSAMSTDELTAAGVNMDTNNAVLDNVAGGMTLLAASTKAVADGLAIMGDEAAAALATVGTSADATTVKNVMTPY